MANQDNSLSAKKKKITITLAVIALIFAFASALPSMQKLASGLFGNSDRQILAKITGFYGADQTEYLILKIKDEFGIQIEIYEKRKENSQQIFKQKFELSQDTDAYITLDKNTTNLALSDVDKDGQLDLLAPSVDRNGNLRLNSFSFNTELNSFEPLQETKTTF